MNADIAASVALARSARATSYRQMLSVLAFRRSTSYWVRKGYISALTWFDLASSGGDADARIRDIIAATKDVVAAQMTPDQIAEAKRRAREWKPKPKPSRIKAGRAAKCGPDISWCSPGIRSRRSSRTHIDGDAWLGWSNGDGLGLGFDLLLLT